MDALRSGARGRGRCATIGNGNHLNGTSAPIQLPRERQTVSPLTTFLSLRACSSCSHQRKLPARKVSIRTLSPALSLLLCSTANVSFAAKLQRNLFHRGLYDISSELAGFSIHLSTLFKRKFTTRFPCWYTSGAQCA